MIANTSQLFADAGMLYVAYNDDGANLPKDAVTVSEATGCVTGSAHFVPQCAAGAVLLGVVQSMGLCAELLPATACTKPLSLACQCKALLCVRCGAFNAASLQVWDAHQPDGQGAHRL